MYSHYDEAILMSIPDYTIFYMKKKSPEIILNLQLWDFFKGLNNEFETAMINEPSVFKPLNVCYR